LSHGGGGTGLHRHQGESPYFLKILAILPSLRSFFSCSSNWSRNASACGHFLLKPAWNSLAGPIDLGVIDGLANLLANLTVRLASSLRVVQTGFVRNYALSIFLGVVIILGYLILR